MGCGSSAREHKLIGRSRSPTDVRTLDADRPAVLLRITTGRQMDNVGLEGEMTEHQKALVRTAWSTLRHDMTAIGINTFLSLFEELPNVQWLFKQLRGMPKETLENSAALRDHSRKVMQFVEKAINLLHKPETLGAELQTLGREHIRFNSTVQQMDAFGGIMLKSIQRAYKNEWTLEINQAWKVFFCVVLRLIKEGMFQELEFSSVIPVASKAELAASSSFIISENVVASDSHHSDSATLQEIEAYMKFQ